jgi:hypothetical protein
VLSRVSFLISYSLSNLLLIATNSCSIMVMKKISNNENVWSHQTSRINVEIQIRMNNLTNALVV